MTLKEINELLNRMDELVQAQKNYVFSKSVSGSDEYASFIDEDVKTFIKNIKQKPGKDIWLIGGGNLAREFFKGNLIDEFQLLSTILESERYRFKNLKKFRNKQEVQESIERIKKLCASEVEADSAQ